MQENKLLSGLNEAQKEAVLHKDGPLLIVAGAGSGKTRVLTHRVAHLIAGGVQPEKILAVTFTNKAAGEMKERIAKLLQVPLSQILPKKNLGGPWIGTFHSLGAWILRNDAKSAGLGKNFSIADEEDSLSLIKESIKEAGADPKQFQPFRIKKVISRKKCELICAEDFSSEARDPFSRTLALIWRIYENKLKSSDFADFDDLLIKTENLFSSHPEILSKYQDMWQYINVDEFQDTDSVQYKIASVLASKHSNICVVGDVDQSIYSFRGADFRNILNFEMGWPGAKVITLEENYRSTPQILDAANAVIAKNKLRKPKNLFTKADSGEKLAVYAAENENDEADFIASEAAGLIKKGVRPEQIAVLFRTNAQSRVLEEKFLARALPYYVVGVKFYARKEVKDVLAYLKSSLNPSDLLSKKRVINLPARGIGKALMVKYLAGAGLKPAEREKIASFEGLLGRIKSYAEKMPASRAVMSAIKESKYFEMFDSGTEEGAMRLANVMELASLSVKFDHIKPPGGLVKMLEEASLMSDQDSISGAKKGVPLTTVHAAKGLEFDRVFIAGLEEGLFPHTAIGGGDEKLRLEEERRLFYVALTRGRKKVYLSLAFFRTIFGERQVNMPSRFLDDIPPELLEKADDEKTIELA